MRFSKILISLTILFFACDDIGKGYEWQSDIPAGFTRKYGSAGYDYGWNASYSPFDEGIIIVGQKNISIIGGQSDLWAIKTDKRGLVEWEKSFGGNNDDVGYDVIATSNGGFLFVGHTWSFGNKQQVYAIKTDFHGNIEWERNYGGYMWDVGTSVIEVKTGGYVLAGFSNSPGISSGNTDMFMIMIDSNGDEIWKKAHGNSAYPNHEWANDIIQLADESFILVGARDRYDKGLKNGLVVKVDKQGDFLWEKEFIDDDQIEESFYSISQSIDGNFYIAGSINSSNNQENYNPKLIKMDDFGNVAWGRVFSGQSRKYHQSRAISTSSGSIIIVGSSTLGTPLGFKEDAFMIKTDLKGNIIWNYSYGTSNDDDWGWSVFETPKKNLVFVGSTKSFGASLFDIYLVGTNADGITQ